ncbi:molybdate ABC transporter substrate-binding protein [Rhizosphaericola mali]|uniref:Molybdate ABC transporter substrate-binding protein n=1 Tax=Rhizosphaericola mali TaxID=2545455 RepID=A0A5P2GA25_9BACT|nr:molybdate ABC transporter substrate-binding protein [Rhizosphaericola mali]QES88391.1 molybdate ABC transporter substrate-binding protein [Rhizosphaericola mali]
MKKLSILIAILFSCYTSFSQEKITVAVAANMQYTIQTLIKEFNKQDKTQVQVVIGASGNLTQEILNGAPFDIFVSADTKFPEKLHEQNKTIGIPKTYAQGILVLWTAKPNIKLPKSVQELKNPNYKKIAIANTETAPYGSAAKYVLEKAKVWNEIQGKLVTGESITQTSQFIATQNVEIGFTAKSIVVATPAENKGKWLAIKAADYPPINQAAALLKNNTEAQKFYNFLYSNTAKSIYKQFGYLVP